MPFEMFPVSLKKKKKKKKRIQTVVQTNVLLVFQKYGLNIFFSLIQSKVADGPVGELVFDQFPEVRSFPIELSIAFRTVREK